MLKVRNSLTQNFKFAASRLTDESQRLIGSNVATVWLSDDTLIKQFNSREGQDFGLEMYADLPTAIFQPDHIVQNGKNFSFIRNFKSYRILVVVKYLPEFNELFLVSTREIGQKELDKLLLKNTVIR